MKGSSMSIPKPLEAFLRIEELIEQHYRDQRHIESLQNRLRYTDAWNDQLRRKRGWVMQDLEKHISSIEESVKQLVDGEISKDTIFDIIVPLLFVLCKAQAREIKMWENHCCPK